ncbi:hypothetical protein ATANTOWER_028004, partial [Ataeniobius toweri]|nr:hypothetical protein [Ataeniobius toweri]
AAAGTEVWTSSETPNGIFMAFFERMTSAKQSHNQRCCMAFCLQLLKRSTAK